MDLKLRYIDELLAGEGHDIKDKYHTMSELYFHRMVLFASEEKFSIYEGYEYQGIILELSLKDAIISFIVFKNNKLHRLSIYEDDVVYFKNNDLNYKNKKLFMKKIREASFKEHRKYIFLVTDKLKQ